MKVLKNLLKNFKNLWRRPIRLYNKLATKNKKKSSNKT